MLMNFLLGHALKKKNIWGDFLELIIKKLDGAMVTE